MEIILIVFLIITSILLLLMKRQERISAYRADRGRSSRTINSKDDYLTKVKKDTESRLENEKKQQPYNNNKKEYL